MPNSTILSLKDISKSYPGVQALDSINIDFHKGEVHAIVGENGAGKSTLIKIITGAVTADQGEIEISDQVYYQYSPHKALFELGIAAIYQEFNLVSSLTVSDNIFYGKEIKKNIFLDNNRMNDVSGDLISSLGFHLNPRLTVDQLSVAEQQIVEIAKALSHQVKILIMDEPTAPLTPNEVSRLFDLIAKLKKQGVTIIYISHRLEESLSISDRITVLRDGKLIKTMNKDETDRKQLISLMVGRTLGQEYPERDMMAGEKVLSVKNITTNAIKDVSFDLYAGEIFGIAGLVGSGRTEIARALFGVDKILEGEVEVLGKEVCINCPSEAMRFKIGLIPEDRKKFGILGRMSVMHNITFSIIDRIARFFLIKEKVEKDLVSEYIKRLSIKVSDQSQLVQNLSGGNQQKVVLSKWLASDSSILIFDEPTRGVDVGAKQEIYYILDELAKAGKGIIMISSDLPELISMSDRIMVMNSGRVEGFVDKADAKQDLILDLASNEERQN